MLLNRGVSRSHAWMSPLTRVKHHGVKHEYCHGLCRPRFLSSVAGPSLLLRGDITQRMRMSWAGLSGGGCSTVTQARFVNSEQFAGLRILHIKSASVLYGQTLPGVDAIFPSEGNTSRWGFRSSFSKQDFLLLRATDFSP